MHEENGATQFKRRIMEGLKGARGPHERIRRASGGNVPAKAELNRDKDNAMRKGGKVHHREHHSWGDFVSGLGSFMKTALPIAAQVAPMFLKKGGKVSKDAEGGEMNVTGDAMRKGGKVHRKHHAAGGVGKLRHGMTD